MLNKTMLLDFGIEDGSKLLGSETQRIKPFLSDMETRSFIGEKFHTVGIFFKKKVHKKIQ
jgi:hypothetical protein